MGGRAILGLGGLCAAAATARAQPSLTEPVPPPANIDERSPTTATALAIAGTVLPVAAIYASVNGADEGGLAGLGGLALLVTPSAGKWYAGELGGKGMALRTLGAFVMLLGFEDSCPATSDCIDNAFIYAGLGLVAVGAAYDIATAGRAVERRNARRRRVVPVVGPGAIGLAGAF